MATLSAGLLNVENLTVTGTQSGAVKASNFKFTNLDLSGNLTVGGNLAFSLAGLYYIVQQTNLADLMKMFDEFETVIQQTNEAYISYAAYKCEYNTYSLTKDGTSAYTKEFISNLSKQYTADQPKPLYTYGIQTRDQCIDLEVAFYDRITDAQAIWENLPGVSEYNRAVAARMFLYMKSWLKFSFYSVRETKGTTNYIKGKADMTDFGTYICNMLNIPFDSVYGVLLTSVSLGINHMLELITLEEREEIALVEDLKVLYTHLLDLISHQIDDYIYGISLGYKFEKNDLYGVGDYEGPVFSGLPDYVYLAQTTDNSELLTAYRANLFTNTPFYFNEFCDTIRSEYTRMLDVLGPYILTSGSLFDDPSTYTFNISNVVSYEDSNVIGPMDYYPDGTPLETRILSTQIASNLAAFNTFNSGTFDFISSFINKINISSTTEINTVLKGMKAWTLEAPVSLPFDPSGNLIQWMPTTIGHGVHESDYHNYYKYGYLSIINMKYNVIQVDSSKNIVLDRKHLFDLSNDEIYGIPGSSVFETAKHEFEVGLPNFPDAVDGLLAYPVGNFTSVGGSNTSDTKITVWDNSTNIFTLADASLYSVGTVVVVKNYCAGSFQNVSGPANAQTDLFNGYSDLLLNHYDRSGNPKYRYGVDYLKYRVVYKSGNNIKICIDSDSSNNIISPLTNSTDVYETAYGNTTWGEFGEYYIRPWSEPILLSNGVSNIFNTDAFSTSGSLTGCFLDLTPGSTTILISWITMNIIRNVRKYQYPKFYTDTDTQILRGVPTLGYCADTTKGGIGAEFRTKTETGWSHDWGTQIDYAMVVSNNGTLFGSYGMDETINGHSVAYALQIARGYNQLDIVVHHSSYYENLSEWNQMLARWRAFEMWDPIYAIDEITDNAVIYNKGVIDGFKRRNTDIQFDVGDPVRICFFDCSGSAQAQSLVEGLGLVYVPGTPTSDYYFVKEVLYDASGYTTGIKISETKGGPVFSLSGGSISNAYIVNAMYEMVAGQYPGTWAGGVSAIAATFAAIYLTDLENYQDYYTQDYLCFWNWFRHSTQLQIYGYGGYFTENYALSELCPLWGQLHDPPMEFTIDDMQENVDNRLKEITQAVNKYNTWDWNLVQVSLNEYKESLQAQLN